MATGDYIAKFNPRSIRKRQPFMYRDLVPGGGAKSKAAQEAAIVAGVPAAREVALANLGSGAEAAYPMQPDVYGGQDTDASSPGPTQITDPNAPQNIPSQRESTPMMGMEQQEAIANQGRGARYDADSIMGLVSSLAGTPKANKAFDSTKPIGGENVPYKPAGIFQRVLGNQANMLNLGAQQAQGAEWKADAALAKERQAKIEDYRTQKGIDAEIATASDEKKRAHEVSMLEKTQQAQREVIKAQQDFTGAQNDKERAEAWKRLESAQTHAVSMQNNALAATAAEGAAGRQLQTDIANLRTRSDDFLARNAVHFGPNGMYSRGSDIFMTTTPMPDKSGKMPLPESIPLTGPSGEGEQVPQIPVGGTTTPTRFEMPQGFTQLPPGGGVMRQGGAASLPVSTPTAAKPAVTPARAAAPGEQGEETRGLIPSVRDYLSSGEAPSMAQEAPTTAQNRAGFMAGLGDIGNFVSEGARSIKPLMLGGRLPRYTPEQGSGVLGMFLNAPGAMMSPVEYGLNTVLRNPMRAMQGVDPTASMAVPSKLQDPSTMYMSDKEYKNYLRSKRLTE